MALSSREITIIVIETAIAIVIGFLLEKIPYNASSFKDSIITLVVIIIASGVILIIIYKKFTEVNEELKSIKTEQKKLNEKLKIYKRLSVIEQKMRIKNGEN